jgi:serine phosphatase RsbU (regulator of sigma subunit)
MDGVDPPEETQVGKEDQAAVSSEAEENKTIVRRFYEAQAKSDFPKGEMFGFPRLRALVAEHGEEHWLGELLLEELYSFVGEGWEQEDDITLLTLRRSAPLS